MDIIVLFYGILIVSLLFFLICSLGFVCYKNYKKKQIETYQFYYSIDNEYQKNSSQSYFTM